jgi:signal transduction histidine kinase
MRLLPRSLAGQLCLLLVVAVIAAQAAAFGVFASETSRVRRAAGRTQVIDRVVTLVRAIETLPAESAPEVAAAFGSPRHRFSIDNASSIEPAAAGSDEARLADLLGRRLRLKQPDPRIALIDRAEDDDDPSGSVPPNATQFLRVSVRLDDGRWLNGEAALRLPAAPGVSIALALLAASVLAVVGVTAIAVRWITRPLTALGEAADRIGRGEVIDTVAISGPREVEATVAAFHEMQQRLTRFVGSRMRMLAAISHDIRTPIASLRLRAEMVEDAELRADMVRTLMGLQQMTEATLSFAREDNVSEETRATDLVALIEAVVEDFRALGHDIAWRAPERLTLRCRPAALRRAIGNLLENAARYGLRARVSLQADKGAARIVIEDDGPGIPADKLEAVFEPFVRMESSRNEETGGIGLGLAIVRSAVQAHGGEIVLVNGANGGLRAHITLPRSL